MLLTSTLMACGGGQLPEAGTQDAELFMQKCTVCHSWPHPARHTRGEWGHYLALMEAHMQAKGIPFPEDEKKVITNYLYRNAR